MVEKKLFWLYKGEGFRKFVNFAPSTRVRVHHPEPALILDCKLLTNYVILITLNYGYFSYRTCRYRSPLT